MAGLPAVLNENAYINFPEKTSPECLFIYHSLNERCSRAELEEHAIESIKLDVGKFCLYDTQNPTMGCMLRSDPMSFCDIYLQPEAAFDILGQLGELGCVQFIDLNAGVQAFQRNYVSDVCRCAEMERRLRYMESAMIEDKIYIPDASDQSPALHPNEMVTYENMFEKWEEDITEMSANQTNLMKNFLEMTEMYYVLSHIGPMLGDATIGKESIFHKSGVGAGDLGIGGRLIVMTGVVRRSRCFHLEMMLWRIARGNIYYRQASEDKSFVDPVTRTELRKVAFLAICQGEQLTGRMEKIFTGFRVNIYPCPETLTERMEMMDKLDVRLADLRQVLEKTRYLRCRALRTVGKKLQMWIIQVKKTKAIYHTMNLFNLDVTKKCLLGQCWVPDQDFKKVRDVLQKCSTAIGGNVPSFISRKDTSATPPTFHRTNKFTKGFQALINAYGDSTYRELNPGLYTIITFPFLFGLMFGDVCHGSVLVGFGAWMVLSEKKYMNQRSTNEIWNIFFGGRYVILLLGSFSIYTGFLYNDWFARAAVVGSSSWLNQYTQAQLAGSESLEIDPAAEHKNVYVFGIDPIWTLSTNQIMFENSVKMKISIIIGIVHMIFGIMLSLFNHLYFKRTYSIYLQFIPEILFLTCLFFWLVFMIYFKWFTYGASFKEVDKGTSCAPQILILFIDMVLMSTTKALDENCKAYMFPGQQMVQITLVFIALACVPILLFGTPIYELKANKKKREDTLTKIKNLRQYGEKEEDNQVEEALLAELAIYSQSFGELMIHQGVHTIEFVLSTISHTASYLRLWALSLAHAQLSDMLWNMVLSKLALREHSLMGAPKVFIIFAIFAAFTMSIMVVMEGLSAFLHTLRLHWVEFMSKFYSGGGTPFRPFCFKVILASEEKSEVVCKKAKKAE